MSEKDLVIWSKDRLLSWADFKAESNPAVYEDSHSYIKYHCTWTVNSEKMGRDILFNIENLQLHVHFHTLLSWVRESEISDSLLLHEQGHFDLAEIDLDDDLATVQDTETIIRVIETHKTRIETDIKTIHTVPKISNIQIIVEKFNGCYNELFKMLLPTKSRKQLLIVMLAD